MTTIVTRAGKGSPLTNNEMDQNLINLNNDKVEGGAITSSGLTQTTARILGRTTGGTGAIEELTAATVTSTFVSAATDSTAGKVELATDAEVQTGTDTTRAVTPAGMKAGLNASGTAPTYAARAWVNFNGTGTVAIRASGNVSSITDNGVGDYTVNFTNALSDANFSFAGAGGTGTVLNQAVTCNDMGKASGSLRVLFSDTAGNGVDRAHCSVVIFR